MDEIRVIISGGGTGGHIFPAIAIANAIKKKRPDANILFVGAEGRMEMEKVPEAGYQIVGLPIMKLKALSMKMKSPGGINDLEKEPAYKRRNIKLEDTPHSSESNVSRYTLGEDEENKTTLKQNNSFLHDNVD